MRKIRVFDCIDVVREAFGVTREEILARRRRLAPERQMIMWLARRHTLASLPQIGAAMAGRDHTTILHGIAQHERRMAEDAGVAKMTRTLAMLLEARQ